MIRGALSKAEASALNGGNTVVVPVSGAAQTLVFPPVGDITYDVTLSANCTFTVTRTNTVAGRRQRIVLMIRNPTGGFTTTLPTVQWSNGVAPTIATTAGSYIEIMLSTTDGGTTLQAR